MCVSVCRFLFFGRPGWNLWSVSGEVRVLNKYGGRKKIHTFLSNFFLLQCSFQGQTERSGRTVHLETAHGLDFKTPNFPTMLYIAVIVLTRIIHIYICKKIFKCYFG